MIDIGCLAAVGHRAKERTTACLTANSTEGLPVGKQAKGKKTMHLYRNTRRTLGFAIVIAILAIAGLAWAASVHLKGGPNAEPDFVDNGLSLTGSGELAGLGNGDVLIEMDATADVISTCTSPGGNEAPGQNPAPITVMGSASIPDSEVQNGNTPFSVMTIAPDPIIAGAPDCPNPNWTESIDDLLFTSAVIRVYQAGVLVLTVTCFFDPPTSDGFVPGGDVTCMQS